MTDTLWRLCPAEPAISSYPHWLHFGALSPTRGLFSQSNLIVQPEPEFSLKTSFA
jgi:hypothetical protein